MCISEPSEVRHAVSAAVLFGVQLPLEPPQDERRRTDGGRYPGREGEAVDVPAPEKWREGERIGAEQ